MALIFEKLDRCFSGAAWIGGVSHDDTTSSIVLRLSSGSDCIYLTSVHSEY